MKKEMFRLTGQILTLVIWYMNQMCNVRMYLKCNTREEIECAIVSTLKISRGKVITNNMGSLMNVAFSKRITAFYLSSHTSGLDRFY